MGQGDAPEQCDARFVSSLSREVAPAVYRLARTTPCLPSRVLTERVGGQVTLKAECLQRTGAFKIRGAISKLEMLGADSCHGVIAASAGNHGQAVALAAQAYGVAADIFVPSTAALGKVAACREYGANVHEVGETVEEAVDAARQLAHESDRPFCHPYDDTAVIAGQATCGLEILDQIQDLAQVVVPLGGGGLLAGVAAVVKARAPEVRVIGVEVDGWTPYARSHDARPRATTLADGIAVSHRGAITGPIIEECVDEIVVVEEDLIADAMTLLLERSKLCVEGAGAVGVAAALGGAIQTMTTGSTCIVLSGGNVDLGVMPNIIRRFETAAGRRVVLRANLTDRPGTLARFLGTIGRSGANVIDVVHLRDGVRLHAKETVVQLVLELRGPHHSTEVLRDLHESGFHAWIADEQGPP